MIVRFFLVSLFLNFRIACFSGFATAWPRALDIQEIVRSKYQITRH